MSAHRVLAVAYACEPDRGSEPGIGWNIVREVARRGHEVWVVTRENNRTAIDVALGVDPEPGLHFSYFDLPGWARWWKRGRRGLQLYYYLWQIGAYRRARALQQVHHFELVHHVTFGRYWTPSFVSQLPVPFVWGPVGGGESSPRGFWSGMSVAGALYEGARHLARWLGEHDPYVHVTARRCEMALATSTETALRLQLLGVRRHLILGNAALNRIEVDRLFNRPTSGTEPTRFLSAGRLLPWKGIALGLRAFALAQLKDAEYWIIGDGPERARLQANASRMGLEGRVRFWGALSREETMHRIGECHVLVHPSLHDSGGWVCIEAMAAGLPVVCLDVGGPALMVSADTGIKLRARNPLQVIADLAAAMKRLSSEPGLREELGARARERVLQGFTWEAKAAEIESAYDVVIGAQRPIRSKRSAQALVVDCRPVTASTFSSLKT